MRTLLQRQPDIDAVFVSSDQMALGALGAAHQVGRRIPQDIAIAGFDNIPESVYFWPPLTTVYQQLIDVGCIAVEQLHQIIDAARRNENHAKPEATMLAPDLVIRASSLQS